MAGGHAQGLAWRGLVAALLAAVCVAAAAQPKEGSSVGIDTTDFAGRHLLLPGVLWEPAGPAKGAVVLVHGSGGWSDFREGHYGRALRAAGYAALAIDTFGPRGIVSTTEDQSQISALQMTRDAFAARRFLVDKGYAGERLAVMGFSKGGTVALYAADRNFLPKERERFALAIPFYAGCNARPRTPQPASVVFMALGEKDDYTGIQPCQDVAADFVRAGGTITVKVYPDSSHGFDGNPALTAMTRLRFVENYQDCVVYLEEDGRYTYGAKTYAPGDAALLADMRGGCVKKGANIWTNTTQKDAATRDVIEFLDRNFAK